MSRGFTLVETMLAAVVGSIVLLGALAVLDTLQRADARIELRAAQNESFARVHKTVRTALDSLVMKPAVSEDPGEPRFRLETRGDGLPRFELVLSRPLFDPIEERQRRDRLEPISTTALRVVGIEDLPECRGAFEVVPDDFDEIGLLGMASLSTRSAEDFEGLLGSSYDGSSNVALVWRRLPPLELAPGLVFDYRTLPPPVVLARGLRGVRWRVFQDRNRVERYIATLESQLPAYVEMDLLGSSGPVASYVFQVAWRRDTELHEVEAPEGAGEDGDTQDGFDEDEIPAELEDELHNFDPTTLGTPEGDGVGGAGR